MLDEVVVAKSSDQCEGLLVLSKRVIHWSIASLLLDVTLDNQFHSVNVQPSCWDPFICLGSDCHGHHKQHAAWGTLVSPDHELNEMLESTSMLSQSSPCG